MLPEFDFSNQLHLNYLLLFGFFLGVYLGNVLTRIWVYFHPPYTNTSHGDETSIMWDQLPYDSAHTYRLHGRPFVGFYRDDLAAVLPSHSKRSFLLWYKQNRRRSLPEGE